MMAVENDLATASALVGIHLDTLADNNCSLATAEHAVTFLGQNFCLFVQQQNILFSVVER